MGTSRNASSKILNGIWGMEVYEWSTVGLTENNHKVIKYTINEQSKSPKYSHSSGVYMIASLTTNEIVQIATYENTGIKVEINWNHAHNNIPKGTPHAHLWVNGQRTDKELSQEELNLYYEAMEYNKKIKSNSLQSV